MNHVRIYVLSITVITSSSSRGFCHRCTNWLAQTSPQLAILDRGEKIANCGEVWLSQEYISQKKFDCNLSLLRTYNFLCVFFSGHGAGVVASFRFKEHRTPPQIIRVVIHPPPSDPPSLDMWRRYWQWLSLWWWGKKNKLKIALYNYNPQGKFILSMQEQHQGTAV